MGTSYSKVPKQPDQISAKIPASNRSSYIEVPSGLEELALAENVFHSMLTLERRRAERSRKPFVLMLLDANLENGSAAETLSQALHAVLACKRDTDLAGWYKENGILGIIFTEINLDTTQPITEILQAKVETALIKHLGRESAAKIFISIHVFPESWDNNRSGWVADSKLYPDLNRKVSRKRFPHVIKRAIDVLGSSALLLVFSPMLAVIAVIIKLTSKGPVLFEQDRLGRLGTRFKCLKFRTMYANNDPKIHQEFIQKFIAGKDGSNNSEKPEAEVYKIANDPRVTSIGRFLRKTSLDELPQFWNVLRGEMSLVGPRPPVPYEVDIYDVWHRRRVMEVKPGVTGLWQVSGRNRTKFDEMVRLDLRYCQNWSIWLDIKILIATPRAVLDGGGAR